MNQNKPINEIEYTFLRTEQFHNLSVIMTEHHMEDKMRYNQCSIQEIEAFMMGTSEKTTITLHTNKILQENHRTYPNFTV